MNINPQNTFNTNDLCLANTLRLEFPIHHTEKKGRKLTFYFNSIDFFSGEYRIIGFKHVITTRECYSEFLLNKGQALAENLKESNGNNYETIQSNRKK